MRDQHNPDRNAQPLVNGNPGYLTIIVHHEHGQEGKVDQEFNEFPGIVAGHVF